MREMGAKGGKAGTGKAKVRGDAEYYRKIRMKGVRKQGKREMKK